MLLEIATLDSFASGEFIDARNDRLLFLNQKKWELLRRFLAFIIHSFYNIRNLGRLSNG
jgi:hypothetical protein